MQEGKPDRIADLLEEVADKIEAVQEALAADNERGAHWLNNAASDALAKEWPRTVEALNKLFE